MSQGQLLDKKITLFALTWPIFVETFLRMLFGNVDTFMLSGYSDLAVAGVGAANQYVFFIIILFQVVSSGTGIVISQYLGAKKHKNASQVAVVSMAVNLALGILISIGMLFFSKNILRIVNFEGEVMTYASQFLMILGTFSFVQALSSTITAVLRSHGFMKYSMYINIGANILNVIGNYIFLKGLFGIPVLGVTGVAIATVISQCVALILIIVVLIKNVDIKDEILGIFSFPKTIFINTFKEVIKIGGPSAGEILSYNISQITITGIIYSMGPYALSARFYVFSIMMFMMLFPLSIGQGTQILIGHMIGAGRMDDAYKECIRSLKKSLIISFSTALVFALLGKHVLGIFTHNEEILHMGSIMLFIAIALEPGRAFNVVVGNCLKGTGDAKFPLFAGVFSMWGVAVFLSYLLGIVLGWGLIGVWTAFALDEWLRGIIMLYRWKSRVWESKSVVTTKLINATEGV